MSVIQCTAVCRGFWLVGGAAKIPSELRPGDIVLVDTDTLPSDGAGHKVLPTSLCPTSDPSLAARLAYFATSMGALDTVPLPQPTTVGDPRGTALTPVKVTP